MRRTVTDEANGRRWEYVNHMDGRYSCTYFEFFKSRGWVKTGNSFEVCKEDFDEAI